MVTRKILRDALSQSNKREGQEVRSINWDAIQSTCRLLADHIQSDIIIRDKAMKGGLLPLARGGLIPATILSHMLNLPIPYVLHPQYSIDMPNDGEYVIVDDICDTGKTFSYYQSLIPRAARVALFCKPQGRDLCDASVIEVPQDLWLKFPWEDV